MVVRVVTGLTALIPPAVVSYNRYNTYNAYNRYNPLQPFIPTLYDPIELFAAIEIPFHITGIAQILESSVGIPFFLAYGFNDFDQRRGAHLCKYT